MSTFDSIFQLIIPHTKRNPDIQLDYIRQTNRTKSYFCSKIKMYEAQFSAHGETNLPPVSMLHVRHNIVTFTLMALKSEIISCCSNFFSPTSANCIVCISQIGKTARYVVLLSCHVMLCSKPYFSRVIFSVWDCSP